MILPAITLESTQDTYCGKEEHTHTDECYEVPGVPEYTLMQCAAQESLHIHTDECYEGGSEPVCGEADYIIHKHIDACYDKGELVCTLPENDEHTEHTLDCYDENGKLICNMTKGISHQHTEDCFVTVAQVEPQGLICDKEEHIHTAECLTQKKDSGDSIMLAATETQPAAVSDGDTSDAVTGTESYTRTYENSAGTQVKITGTAYSDKATSQIESIFAGTNNSGSVDNDGRVLTDKSVIYGKDDYGAFSSYDANTFSVTLSALGQQYENTKSTVMPEPLDVVFIVDMSSSMYKNSDDNGKTRAENTVDAVNDLVSYTMGMTANDGKCYNRVGIVGYSSAPSDVLSIGSYPNAVENNILSYSSQSIIVNSDVAGTSKTVSFSQGTYTIAGYYQAAQMLTGISDTTVKIGDATVQRVPVIILITDGEARGYGASPDQYLYSSSTSSTATSSGYDDAMFYTILSAYHYKSEVAKHYFGSDADVNKAKLYTIGIGRDSEITAAARASLDPTSTNIENAITAKSTRASDIKNWTNIPASYKTAYDNEDGTGNYYFCDGSYTAATFSTELTAKIKNYIKISAGEYIYSSSQYTKTDITMTDEIGAGMEIKTDKGLVLRYNGKNYPLTLTETKDGTSTYCYSGTDKVKANQYGDEVSLSDIKVTIDKTSDGNQRITWDIPSGLLPEYTHARTDIWYYQMLPVRLMYQVGLTEESQKKIDAMDEDSDNLIFYTNAADTDNATAIIVPNEASEEVADNPYYFADDYSPESFDKEENTTYTRSTYLEVSAVDAQKQVIFTMGNNGKLVFSSATKTPDPSSDKTSVTVNKVWKDRKGNVITDTSAADLPSITIAAKADGKTYATHVINESSSWQYTFADLPSKNKDGSVIVWTVDEENVSEGYEKEGVVQTGTAFTVTNKAISSVTLTIKKVVQATDTSGSFEFEASWTDEQQQPQIKTFSLQNNESHTIEGIPDGAVVKIKELGSDGYVVSFIKGESKQSGLSEYTITMTEDAEVTVQNTAGVILPETGGRGVTIYVCIGLALMLMAASAGVFLIVRMRRRENSR